ncbi:hypothetical protein V8E54_003827 [Elaphomyces granulatus]
MAFQVPEDHLDFSCEFGRINLSAKQLWSLVAALINLQTLRYFVRALCVFGSNTAPSRAVRSLVDRTELRVMDILFSLLRLDECQSNGYRGESPCITAAVHQVATNSALGESHRVSGDSNSIGKQNLAHEVESLVALNGALSEGKMISSWVQNTQSTTGHKSQEPMRTNKSPDIVPIIPSAPSQLGASPSNNLEIVSMATCKTTPQIVNNDSVSDSIYSSSSREHACSDQSLSGSASGTALVSAGNMYAELILKEHPFGPLSRHTSIQVAVPKRARSPSHCRPGVRTLVTSCDSSLSSKFSSSYPGNSRLSSY